MKYICTTILAYFVTDTLNWQLLWFKEKYLFSWKIKKCFCKTIISNEESIPSKDTSKIKVKYIAVSFLNRIKL